MKRIIFFVMVLVMFASCSLLHKSKQQNMAVDSVSVDYTTDYTLEEQPKVDTLRNEMPLQEPIVHVVQKGESMWEIARKYNCTVKAIAELNQIENPGLIKIGQKLKIPLLQEENE